MAISSQLPLCFHPPEVDLRTQAAAYSVYCRLPGREEKATLREYTTSLTSADAYNPRLLRAFFHSPVPIDTTHRSISVFVNRPWPPVTSGYPRQVIAARTASWAGTGIFSPSDVRIRRYQIGATISGSDYRPFSPSGSSILRIDPRTYQQKQNANITADMIGILSDYPARDTKCFMHK